MRVWRVLLAMLLSGALGCTAPARPAPVGDLKSWIPNLKDGITTLAEVQQHVGPASWEEMEGRVRGYKMTKARGRPIQPGWFRGEDDHYYLVVSIDGAELVRAHSLVLARRDGRSARLRESDVSSLPAELSLEQVLLALGPPHSKSQGEFVVYGWGNVGKEEYRDNIGNQAGGFLVLQVGPDFRVRRRYVVDRKRWEDNIREGVSQTKKYWQFLDEHQPPNG